MVCPKCPVERRVRSTEHWYLAAFALLSPLIRRPIGRLGMQPSDTPAGPPLKGIKSAVERRASQPPRQVDLGPASDLSPDATSRHPASQTD
jgi:hypothetical protein